MIRCRAGFLTASLAVPVLSAEPTAPAVPPSPLEGQVVHAWLENDLVAGIDRHYTHGTRLGYLSAEGWWDSRTDSWLVRLAGWLPAPCQETSAWRAGITVTQNIYTPADLDSSTVVANDRPYAGWLYLNPSIQRRGLSSGGTPVLDTWGLELGVVGPASLARDAQNAVHDFGARGWDNQLDNEPDLGIRYAKVLRYSRLFSDTFGGQFLPSAGFQLGTVQSYLSLGLQVRVGWNLPDDFGGRGIDGVVPASGGRLAGVVPHRGFHLLAGVEGRAFGNNMLLDGNLYHDSHSVRKFPLVGDFRVGVVYVGQRWDIGYTHTFRGKEFHGQPYGDAFGSVSVAYKW